MPIHYDEKYVKRPNEELEYTPEQIDELIKCQNDCKHFIKYIKIVNPDIGEMEFTPYEYQKNLIGTLQNSRYSVGLWSRQSGKCVQDAEITIKNKKTGEIETVQIGLFYNRVQDNQEN